MQYKQTVGLLKLAGRALATQFTYEMVDSQYSKKNVSQANVPNL